MHRSSSYYLQQSSSSTTTASPSPATGAAAASGPSGTAGAMDVDHLPTYDPRSDAAKKEALDASRADLARTLVHLVPVVVLLCGLLLWSLSNTDVPEVGVLLEKGNDHTMVTRVNIMAQNNGVASNWKGSGMMTTTEDSDPIDEAHGTKRRVLIISEM
ncbi:hypothetical protein HU200_036521 [Digitaria exilis]|uniref:Uncharacterized protein n=1 Tax=Digitaria exilis TaxID=1010633 RepID=A0A835BGD5_9POAL|nr:hypothetical protein HU200_036521 [Digitaria exilis]CAB3477595.1 unnamed protein product [Digitaria exilis]